MPDAAAVHLRTAEGAMTQKQMILHQLRQAGDRGLTPLEALDGAGSFRLAARIWDLRQDGYDIEAQSFTTDNGATVARYVLHEEHPEQIRMFG